MMPPTPPIRAAPPAPPANTVSNVRRLSWCFENSMIVLLSDRLRDANDAHHAGLLVVGDVAVKHPIAGVVGDKGEVCALARRQEHGVAPLPGCVGFSVPADDAEAVAGQM